MANENGNRRKDNQASKVVMTPISAEDVEKVLDRAIAREGQFFRLTEGQRRALVRRHSG